MKPVHFKHSNCVIGKDQPQYKSLPAFKEKSVEGRVAFCYELSVEEIQKIIDSRRIWVMQVTFNKPFQPILLSVDPLVVLEPVPSGLPNDDSVPNESIDHQKEEE